MLWDWELELVRRQWRRGKNSTARSRVNTFLIVFAFLGEKKRLRIFCFVLDKRLSTLFFACVTHSLSTSYEGAGAAPP